MDTLPLHAAPGRAGETGPQCDPHTGQAPAVAPQCWPGDAMSDEHETTIRIQRPARVRMDGRGRSVWTEPVETAELELMSSQALKKILASKDEKARESIEAATASGGEGVLARDPATGRFEIVDDADLQKIFDSDPGLSGQDKGAEVTYEAAYTGGRSAGDLSLVSTQALRRILGKEEVPEPADADIEESGFDPYDRN